MDISTLSKTETEIISPLKLSNYDFEEPNLISDLGFKPFSERTKNLIDSFNDSIDEYYTKTLGVTCYNFDELTRQTVYFSNGTYKESIRYDLIYNSNTNLVEPVVYDGVYKFDDLKNYIGEIPEKNQKEIKYKFDMLNSNPLISIKFRLVILAPLNNFAEENNITAIDPIVFAWFSNGEHCYSKTILIPLTWWV